MSPAQVENWIVRLRQRLDTAEATAAGLSTRVQTLEGILLNVPADRLLGRHATTAGPAQYVRIGTGLDLQADVLVNTGGGGGGSVAIASFTLICIEDASEHEITCVLVDGYYTLRVNQSPGGSAAVSGKTLTCVDDASDHVLRLRLVDGYYTLEMVQSPGGSGAVDGILMTCATDATEQTLTCILADGFYTWTFS
jgi:hypothetical protein